MHKQKGSGSFEHQIKTKWRYSINQLFKLEAETKLTRIDKQERKINLLKIRMKNRLAQIDDDFRPFLQIKQGTQANPSTGKKTHRNLLSTNHDSNNLKSEGLLTRTDANTNANSNSHNFIEHSILDIEEQRESNIDFEQLSEMSVSTIRSRLQGLETPFSHRNHHPSKEDLIVEKRKHDIQAIREDLMEDLTEYNQSRYELQMKEHCSKFNPHKTDSLQSVSEESQIMKRILPDFIYSIFTKPKPLYEFCYTCDEIISDIDEHICQTPLDSLEKVQRALARIEKEVNRTNNKIFSVFLHNTMDVTSDIDELISNVRVLKQAEQVKYEAGEAVLRMRLINLIGKKIGLLLEYKELSKMMRSLGGSSISQPSNSKFWT